MATERVQRIAVEEPSGFPEAAAAEDSGIVAQPSADVPASVVLLEQERRQAAVRGIQGKLGDLEGGLTQLRADLGKSQRFLGDNLDELQRRTARITADLLSMARQAESDRTLQGQEAKALETRLSAGLADLREQLLSAANRLQSQQGSLQALAGEQQALAAISSQQGEAIHYLDEQGREQGRQLQSLEQESRRQGDVLRSLDKESRQQFRINRSHIDALQNLQREQREQLQELTVAFNALVDQHTGLNLRVDDLQGTVAAEQVWVRQGFRYFAGALATVALLAILVTCWFAWHPVAAPASVKAQLGTLSAQVAQQSAAQQTMAAQLQSMQGKLASLDNHMIDQSGDIAKLQQEVQHSVTVLKRVRRSEAAIRQQVGRLERRVDGVEQVNKLPATLSYQ